MHNSEMRIGRWPRQCDDLVGGHADYIVYLDPDPDGRCDLGWVKCVWCIYLRMVRRLQ